MRNCLAALALLAALSACRDEEQHRVLLYDKGTYLGQSDSKLTQQQVDALRQRTLEQQGFR